MTCQSQKVVNVSAFTESTWSDIVDHIGESFRLTADEKAAFRDHAIPKLIGAIPFLAGCDHPMRTSIANLAIYMMSIKSAKATFDATPLEDSSVFDRLSLARFEGGDTRIIDRGMALLALNMIADYRRDAIYDIANGKHNPIAVGNWDYQEMESQLKEIVQTIACPEMDDIAPITQMQYGFWNAAGTFPSWF